MIEYSAMFYSGFDSLKDYVFAHTLFCLIPAFFMAGAMTALIPKEIFLPYLGKDAPKYVAYPIAVVAGLMLSVCSCTVLPLFAGIMSTGAGIGPALAFLYTAPATNILAVLYTGELIGWKIAAARIFFSVLFAVLIGMVISKMFKAQENTNNTSTKTPTTENSASAKIDSNLRRLLYLFSLLITILITGTKISNPVIKYPVVGALTLTTVFVSFRFFAKDERKSWMLESWGFTKKIFPILLIGVFISGIFKYILPQEIVAKHLGSNTLLAVIIPVIFGIFVYFPTLVEVPIAKMFLSMGMAQGPLLAYLLADPVISLPSILTIRKLIGTKRTLTYVILIFIFSVAAGLIYGILLT